MKLSCTKENLLAGLTAVSRVASKNLTLPILGNILLKTENGALTLGATNLEVGMTTRVRSKVVEDGAITVQARLLTEYVALLERERIEIETDGSSLTVAGEGSTTTVRGISADDFPIIPTVPREKGFTVGAQELREALEQTLFAAAQDSSRPEISGAYLSVSQKELVVATTDSYRLAEKRIQISGGPAPYSSIVPTRALYELSRVLPPEGAVQVFIGNAQALFVVDGTELTTRLIEGQYPDYTQIIPKASTTEAHVESEALIRVIKTSSLFVRSGINDVTLSLDPETKKISLAAANAELGEHHGEISAKISGKPATMVFNFRYLLDGLSVINAKTITLGVTDSGSPGIIRAAEGGEGYLYLVMPIRQ